MLRQTASASVPAAEKDEGEDEKHWIEIQLEDQEGLPVASESFEIELPDGSIVPGRLDQDGLARLEGIDTPES